MKRRIKGYTSYGIKMTKKRAKDGTGPKAISLFWCSVPSVWFWCCGWLRRVCCYEIFSIWYPSSTPCIRHSASTLTDRLHIQLLDLPAAIRSSTAYWMLLLLGPLRISCGDIINGQQCVARTHSVLLINDRYRDLGVLIIISLIYFFTPPSRYHYYCFSSLYFIIWT